MLIQRHAEATITRIAAMFGAVLVTGARQVGKTTLLQMISSPARYVTLDDPIALAAAREHGATFLKENPPPVFFDEIQYAPELFPYIKMYVDQSRTKGLFYMSGSQQFALMKNVSESLAGRLGVLTLPGISLREQTGVVYDQPFLPDDAYFADRKQDCRVVAYDEVWRRIQRGSMPELCANPEFDWRMFHASYVKTYIERDVRDLTQVGDELRFMRFMTAAAATTGQLLNLASLARDVGISQPTAERWLSILRTSNLIALVQPWSMNASKRAVKTPKLYFLDTGLAAWLTGWNTAETLRQGAMAGPFFETFVVSEILKSYNNAGIDERLFFYRDRDSVEIDLLLWRDGWLHPIEIKKHAEADKRDCKSFAVLDKFAGVQRGPGGVVCLYDGIVPLTASDRTIPVWMI